MIKRMFAVRPGISGALMLLLFAFSPALGALVAAEVQATNPRPVSPQAISPPWNRHVRLPCRLEVGADCSFPVPLNSMATVVQMYPPEGASGTQHHKPISVTLDRPIDPTTLHSQSFLVSLAGVPVSGSVRYINVSRMAVFYPNQALAPNRTYTARLTRDVRDTSGLPLRQTITWSFSTADSAPASIALSPSSEPKAAAAVAAEPGMNIYFGDLHSQSGYSDGHGTAADAFATARANGLDFFALTDHGFLLDRSEWQEMLYQANTATAAGEFVALRGFEYTHVRGHLNVFDTETYVSRDDPRYDTLPEFYAWLVAQPRAIGQFNHPFPNFNFDNFPYDPAVDEKIVLRELTVPNQFFLSLNNGWRVSTLMNSDTHVANWGCCPTMGLAAPALDKENIIEAIRAGRTFFVSPNDKNLAVLLQANGQWMGATIHDTAALNFVITAHDPDPTGGNLNLILYDNGVIAAAVSLQSSLEYTWPVTLPATAGHYYYAEAYYDAWSFPPAISSPIWVR